MYDSLHKNTLKTPRDKRATEGRLKGDKEATRGRQNGSGFGLKKCIRRSLIHGVLLLLSSGTRKPSTVISSAMVANPTFVGLR